MGGSDRWTHGAGNSFQRLVFHSIGGVLVVLLSLAMGPLWAQGEYIPRGQPIPQSVRFVNAYPGGANMTGSAAWTSPLGQTSHHRFSMQYSAATLGKLAKASVKRGLPLMGWGIALKQAIEVSGWVIDELGNVVEPGQPSRELEGDTFWCVRQSDLVLSATYCTDDVNQLAAWLPGKTRVVNDRVLTVCEVAAVGSKPGVRCQQEGSTSWVAAFGWTGTLPSEYQTPEFIEGRSIGDAELGQQISTNGQVVNGVSVDPDTGAPRRTAELINAINTLARALEAANGLTPGELGTLEPGGDLGDPVPSQSEWPGFCDWATAVCEFLEWVREDAPDAEKPEVPVEELLPEDIQQSWSSGLGGGSCPAPYSVPILDGTFEVSWDGICGFVDMLRPLLITIALVVGACIVAGVRVGKNA